MAYKGFIFKFSTKYFLTLLFVTLKVYDDTLFVCENADIRARTYGHTVYELKQNTLRGETFEELYLLINRQ